MTSSSSYPPSPTQPGASGTLPQPGQGSQSDRAGRGIASDQAGRHGAASHGQRDQDLHPSTRQALEWVDEGSVRLKQGLVELERLGQRDPLQAVGIAFGIGLMLGVLR